MTKRHFEYLAAMLADIKLNGTPVDQAVVQMCHHFGANFDEGRFRDRVEQLATDPERRVWKYVR